MKARVGDALFDCAAAAGLPSIVVVGTGKNVGKTTVVRALCDALALRGRPFGLTSIGRDGEGVDASDAMQKPRLYLRPGATIATARDVLPPTPALEIADLSAMPTAAGRVVYARVRQPGYFEIAGPPTASGMRAAVHHLHALGCSVVLIDGAVDRVAALAGGRDAVIVATGAASASTLDEAVRAVEALVSRLRIPQAKDDERGIEIDGALSAARISAFIQAKETRPIIVRDPTQIAVHGRAYLAAAAALQLRCKRPLRVVAVTVASIGRDRYFEPREFARRVQAATHLPTFDVYTGEMVAA